MCITYARGLGCIVPACSWHFLLTRIWHTYNCDDTMSMHETLFRGIQVSSWWKGKAGCIVVILSLTTTSPRLVQYTSQEVDIFTLIRFLVSQNNCQRVYALFNNRYSNKRGDQKQKRAFRGNIFLHLRANLQVKIRMTKGCKCLWNTFKIWEIGTWWPSNQPSSDIFMNAK